MRYTMKQIRLLCISLLILSVVCSAQVTNPYHFQREFVPVTYTNTGTPSAYQIIMGARALTGIVGPTNIIVLSNETYATEYEGFGLGYESPNAAWTSVFAIYQNYYSNYPGMTYDNAGWIKGTHQAYGDWGAYIWLLQNTIAFMSSASTKYVSPYGVTSEVASVLVGTLGDYCPQTFVTDTGPVFDTNYPGSNNGTDQVFRADTTAYYKLVLFMYLGVNNDDSDGDGIPDFADGYNLDGSPNADDLSTNDYFTTWPLLLSGYANPTQATVRITYNASDPAGVTGGTNYTAASGDFRLWKKQAYKARNKASISSGGDYVPPSTYMATSLGFSASARLLDLFIEPVNPGTNRQLVVEVDPDGGGPKDFVCVDKWESTIIRIEALDWLATTNKALHHTDLYQTNALVLRRCDKFEVDVRLSSGFSSTEHKLWFEAFDTFDGSLKTSKVPAVTADLSPGEWYAKLLTVSNNVDGTKTARVEINIPTNCPIGEYQWEVKLSPKSADSLVISQKLFPDYVIVLFNPWNAADSVYMANDSDRQEYVLRTSGIIWRGERQNKTTKVWRFAQFNSSSLSVLLAELVGQDRIKRRDAILISRHLSSRVNSNGGGILTGRWDGNYAGGTDPSDWSGSHQILDQYQSSGTAVAYGQCWVFGGLLTTMLRCVGIPARPVSNFDSGHDADANKFMDYYFKTDGTFDDASTRDSIWNFHVWCDAWMKRPDQTGRDGWQAVDATPQELSAGAFQCGPASLAAVKGNLGGEYDVDFVYAEVSAPMKQWRALPGGGVALAGTVNDVVGHDISTKTVSATTRHDITSEYK